MPKDYHKNIRAKVYKKNLVPQGDGDFERSLTERKEIMLHDVIQCDTQSDGGSNGRSDRNVENKSRKKSSKKMNNNDKN